MDFSLINEITKQSEYLPTRKLKDLQVQGDYIISDVRMVKTKFGDRCIAEIQGEYTVFLPARIIKAIQQNPPMFEELFNTARAGQLSMKYLGGNLNGIEFHKCEKL